MKQDRSQYHPEQSCGPSQVELTYRLSSDRRLLGNDPASKCRYLVPLDEDAITWVWAEATRLDLNPVQRAFGSQVVAVAK